MAGPRGGASPAKRQSNGPYEQLDPATRFFYVPHTVTFLLVGAQEAAR